MSPIRLRDVWTAPTVRAALVGLGCLLGAECGHLLSFTSQDRTLAIFWPPAGLLLAVLALTRYRLWPAFLLSAAAAMFASSALHQQSLPVALGFCVASAAEACLGAWLLRRCVGRPVT